MENLPEVQPDAPLAPPPDGRRELVVVGDEVYLPQSEAFTPDDPQFADTVAGVLPDYAASLSEEALRRPRGYSAGAILLILLFLGGVLTFSFVMRPQVRLESISLEVPKPEITNYAGEFSQEYQQAMDCVKSRRYRDARKILLPVVNTLLARREAGPRNEPIFFSYFELCERLKWKDDRDAARLKRLIELDDQYRWELFDILRRLEDMGGKDPDMLPEKLIDYRQLTAPMQRIDDLRARFKDDNEHDRELRKKLDLYKCIFGLKLWRFKNYPDPDDEIGVEDREEVLEIADQYPRNREFIKIRIYLIKTLLRDGISWYYTYRGERKWDESVLKGELKELEALLKKIDAEPRGN